MGQATPLYYTSRSLPGAHRRACPGGGMTDWLPGEPKPNRRRSWLVRAEERPSIMSRSLPARTSQDREKAFRRCLPVADQLPLRRDKPGTSPTEARIYNTTRPVAPILPVTTTSSASR